MFLKSEKREQRSMAGGGGSRSDSSGEEHVITLGQNGSRMWNTGGTQQQCGVEEMRGQTAHQDTGEMDRDQITKGLGVSYRSSLMLQ